ncbi:MAG: hypothetical protein AAB971_02905 [Patescibacteria group bacterium]
MFEKLLAILPYNPGIAHELRFYAKRMHEEAAIRRTGLVFIILTFFVQFFAVLSPPQPTVAAADNSLVSGGISSAGDARQYCDNNTRHFKTILEHYGITCYNVATGDMMTINSGARDYYSMGWNPQGATNNVTGKRTNETPIRIPGLDTLYMRKLNSWDSASSAPYKALRVTSGYTGTTYYLIVGCGNLVSVGLPTPYVKPTPTPPPPPAPTPTTPTPPPPPAPCPYDSKLLKTDAACKPCPYNGSILDSSPLCKPCDSSLSSQDAVACVVVSKTASNVTTGLADANNSTAKAGDAITYTLYAKNNGKAKVKQYTFQENLSDIMDYADPTDLHGGSIDNNKLVTWPTTNIEAGQTASVKITVTVKNPIPQTPASAGDPNHFDLAMVNVYGNTITIHLPGSPVKTIEGAATTLPNTGPGTSLLLTATVVIIAGYFYGRARLLSRESELAIQGVANA